MDPISGKIVPPSQAPCCFFHETLASLAELLMPFSHLEVSRQEKISTVFSSVVEQHSHFVPHFPSLCALKFIHSVGGSLSFDH
jgi:hypothetical protein